MLKMTFACFFTCLLAVSCKKSSTSDPVTPATENYMNFTTGSTWNYEIIDNIAASTSLYTITSTNRDSTFLGNTYHVFTNSNGPSQYYGVTGNEYFDYEKIPSGISSSSRKNKYLIADLAKAESWQQTYPIIFNGVQRTLFITNTITDKGISKTVNGITYTNVIYVKTALTIEGIPAGLLTSDISSYYAPHYGLIENSSVITVVTIGVPATQSTTTRLKTAVLL